MRRAAFLALATVLLISLVSASAAAVPDPDDVKYPKESIECPEMTDAVSPLSDTNSSEYLDCKEKSIAQWTERTVKKDIQRSLRSIQNLEDQLDELVSYLESQAERASL